MERIIISVTSPPLITKTCIAMIMYCYNLCKDATYIAIIYTIYVTIYINTAYVSASRIYVDFTENYTLLMTILDHNIT